MVVARRLRRTVRATSSARRSVNCDGSPEDSPEHSPIPSPRATRKTKSTKVSIDSSQSPYWLSNSDNPGLTIISEVLDGSNYDDWQIAMMTSLDAKNKMSFIDGSLPRPDESDEIFRIWSRCNSMVKSWLLNSVSKQIYKSILRFSDSSEIWKDLRTRFHITNVPRSYQLSQQVWSLQQGTMDLATYYTTLKTLWNELDGANCVKVCRNCNCCKAQEKKAENARVIKFLAGLNESYSVIRSQIIMKKHIPEMAEVYNLIDQDHSQRNISPMPNAVAFQVTAPAMTPDQIQASVNATYNGQKPKVICSHCGYTGHTVDKCYKVHGYPQGFKHKNKTNSVKPVVAQLALTDSTSSI